jgi:hypothetical protein
MAVSGTAMPGWMEGFSLKWLTANGSVCAEIKVIARNHLVYRSIQQRCNLNYVSSSISVQCRSVFIYVRVTKTDPLLSP